MKIGIRGKLFLVSLGLIAISVVVVYGYARAELERQLTDSIRDDLLVRAELVAHEASAFQGSAEDFKAWDELADELGRRAEGRVSLIRSDGVVMGDSEVALAALPKLENHAHRPEVESALKGGRGENQRTSATIDRRMLYVAVPITRGGERIGVARVALRLTQVDAALERLHRVLAVGVLIALGLAVVMSSVAAQLASRTARSLTDTAQRMAGGDLRARLGPTADDEFGALARALDRLAQGLSQTLSELREERDLLGGILAGMQEGVLMLDRTGKSVLANPALREMLLLGSDYAGKTPIEMVRQADLKELIDRVRESGEPESLELDVTGLKPRRLLVRAAPLEGAQGGLFAVFVDVTEMRRLESLRRDFVANVSHELRTPVTAIRSAAETLDGAISRDPEASRQFVDIITRNAERLKQLVEDLLDLSRIESHKLKLDLEPIEVRAVYDHVSSLFRERADKKGMKLELDLPDDLPAVRADRRALEHVLTNLVDNAVKYCGSGVTVELGATAEASKVHLRVRDTGPGIEQRHLPRLFERFYRVDAGRSREVGGTGLGLAIVKHLVEAMSGNVSVSSAPGSGTTFSVSLQPFVVSTTSWRNGSESGIVGMESRVTSRSRT